MPAARWPDSRFALTGGRREPTMPSSPLPIVRSPVNDMRSFFRMLAINLAAGIALAILLVSGFLGLDIGGLRRLILADRDGLTALCLLLFGFIVTLGSLTMGSAIISLGSGPLSNDASGTGTPARAPARVTPRRPNTE
jgi:hypothetical protein